MRARVGIGVGRPRDDQNLIRLRHAHLRPRRCAGVRLQQDEPVVLLLLRHPPRHLGPVKLRLQLTHGVVVEHAARGGLVEPQRRSESPQRAAQVPRQRRRRPGVRRTRRRHEADGDHVRLGARAFQRRVKLPSHRLEKPGRGDGVPGAHQRQRPAGHSHQLAVSEAHGGGRVSAAGEEGSLADGLAATAFLVGETAPSKPGPARRRRRRRRRRRSRNVVRGADQPVLLLVLQQTNTSGDEDVHARGLLALQVRGLAGAEPDPVQTQRYEPTQERGQGTRRREHRRDEHLGRTFLQRREFPSADGVNHAVPRARRRHGCRLRVRRSYFAAGHSCAAVLVLLVVLLVVEGHPQGLLPRGPRQERARADEHGRTRGRTPRAVPFRPRHRVRSARSLEHQEKVVSLLALAVYRAVVRDLDARATRDDVREVPQEQARGRRAAVTPG